MRRCFHRGCDTMEALLSDRKNGGDENFSFLKLTTQALVLTCLDLTTERENGKSSLSLDKKGKSENSQQLSNARCSPERKQLFKGKKQQTKTKNSDHLLVGIWNSHSNIFSGLIFKNSYNLPIT